MPIDLGPQMWRGDPSYDQAGNPDRCCDQYGIGLHDPCSHTNAGQRRIDLSREQLPQRMRTRRGRVMHRVIRRNSTATYGEPTIESMCRNRRRGRDIGPRAQGRASEWSSERYWYPDCTHCPADAKPAEQESNAHA